MATKEKTTPKSKTQPVDPAEQYKRDMLDRRNALRKLQGIDTQK
jgi:hypothetical protein